jgi:PAS domain S-box-containing protein
MARLLENMRVHEIELEMQNEELRRVRDQLEESRDRYADLYDFAPVGYATLDAGGIIREINLSAAQLLGSDRQSLMGRSFSAMVTPEQLNRFREHLKECGKTSRQLSVELTLVTRLGPIEVQLVTLQTRRTPGAGAGAGAGAGVFRVALLDVTAQRKSAREMQDIERKVQEAQKLESLGVLAGGLAHDFNNILAAVLASANLARLHLGKGSEAMVHLEQVEQSVNQAAALCRQLLAYSGRGQFSVETLDLNLLIQECQALLELSISKQTVLEFDLALGLPGFRGDAVQIRQVLMNLVMNASEAIKDQVGVVTVSTFLLPAEEAAALAGEEPLVAVPDTDCVCLKVKDTGHGIKPKDKQRIFEPFYSTKFTGRGLGLSAVRGIVRGHRAGLAVESVMDKGSSFFLMLPAVGTRAAVVVPRDQEEHLESWEGKGKVLLADDDGALRPLFETMLRQCGFAVVQAADGAEAVKLFRQGGYAAVLLDLTMPVMDGLEASRIIRKEDADIPILLMSGYNQQEVIGYFTPSGPNGFLEKPFGLSGLRRKLFDLMENRRTMPR